MSTSPWEVCFTDCASRRLSPRVRRIVSREPIYGGEGLRTYLVGEGDVAVIDPAPNSRPLLDAILAATEGERITHVLMSHTHGRRSALAAELAARSGAQVLTPEQGLTHGRRIAGPDWTLQALSAPGHTLAHFVFALEQESLLFTGELASGWSADPAIAREGDLAAALASFRAVRRAGFHRLLPAIGPEICQVQEFLTACLVQAARRELVILSLVERAGACSAWDLAEGCDARLHGLVQPAAADLLLAYLVKLARERRLAPPAQPSLFTRFAAVAPPRAAPAGRRLRGHRLDNLWAFPLSASAIDAHFTSLETAQRQTGARR
jgi:glyoxylase-like metal-dependent hydrolase (beta-lactamase superfamily II)